MIIVKVKAMTNRKIQENFEPLILALHLVVLEVLNCDKEPKKEF